MDLDFLCVKWQKYKKTTEIQIQSETIHDITDVLLITWLKPFEKQILSK